MDSTQLAVIFGGIAYNLLMYSVVAEVNKNRNRRRWWVRPIFQNRESFGDAQNLVPEMLLSDEESFFNYTRMTYEQFEKLLGIIGPKIKKNSLRKPLTEKERLLVTLRFLATGNSYGSLSFAFRIGKSTVHNIVNETTEVIWLSLFDEYIGVPDKNKFREIADKFYRKCKMPNCVGAIDGKHCTIQAPPQTGTLYYNYKKQFSVVLLAVCDADCNFTYVNIGAFGSESDGGILKKTEFGKNLLANKLDFPEESFLPNSTIKYPYYMVGDEAFPLKKNLLRPYGGKNLPEDKQKFNKHLSLARRLIENTFGILVSKFRIYRTTIVAHPELASSIIKCTVVLHNFIRKTRSQATYIADINEHSIDIEYGNFEGISQFGSNHPSNEATYLRNILKDYFNEQT